jgi:hypothetical protein
MLPKLADIPQEFTYASRLLSHQNNNRCPGTMRFFLQYYANPTSSLPAGAAWLIARRYQQLSVKLSRHKCSCPQSRYVLVIVLCVLIWFGTLLNWVFYVRIVVKCGSEIKCQRKFRLKHPGNTVPSRRGIHELIKKVRSTGSLLDKKSARNAVRLPKVN